MIIGIQYQKSLAEISLSHTSEAYRVVFQDLEKEKSKVQQLEFSVNDLHPTVGLVLEKLRRNENNSNWLNDKEMYDDAALDNQYHMMHQEHQEHFEDAKEEEQEGSTTSDGSCEILT
ncbi:hypothetical protein N7466_009414 [Penicillium verhagenii]|uniref:uncharacterized protein n=1 Tax=Penicillium verhagenii TaxID=1562060 RepID=UPI00254587F2|nr:uncharacterized protein N7466_009414 [Penicillium verhagenii]KAJ5921088.1 hypothetical protein N7466_009414 [Penicillium verhagenii]